MNMKPIAAFISALVLLSAHSAHAGNSVYAEQVDYANGGLTLQHVDGINNMGIAVIGTVGKKFPEIDKNFSAEAEASFSLIDPSESSVDVSVYSAGGYGAYTHHLSGELRAKYRAGLVLAHSQADCGGLCRGSDDTDLDVSLGASLIYDYRDNYKIFADWTMLTSEVSHLGVGVRYEYK
ncbi:MAG: hypothetical protein OEW58_10275 [Gammaproteobacteria bacterium]|nr:hypothetical protein [Gammaproteobacteria bacterium]